MPLNDDAARRACRYPRGASKARSLRDVRGNDGRSSIDRDTRTNHRDCVIGLYFQVRSPIRSIPQQPVRAGQTMHVQVTLLYAGPKLDPDALRNVAQTV